MLPRFSFLLLAPLLALPTTALLAQVAAPAPARPAALPAAAVAVAVAVADSAADDLPRLTLGLSTGTRTTYLQRAPPLADDRGYFGPTVIYQAPSGFISSLYLNHSYNYETLREPFFNFGELMAGWQATGDGDTYWTVQYTRLFTYGDSPLVQAGLRNNFGASITQFFDQLTASLSADYFAGNTRDFVLTLNLSHRFELPIPGPTTGLSLEPTLEMGAGSQRFYAASLGRTTVIKRRKRAGGPTSVFTEPAAPGFSVLGVSLAVPLTFTAGRLSVVATPAYLVPLHVPEGGLSGGFFYGVLGVSRTFW